ncbi:MAG TPA: DPP IV N-terminal domain-containing protein [Niabella sp.]|nr:DPP IV N-terminal domain-containing protein [Niabella sp.]HOZ98103.1 DPP IV N-terminal domain-containing protein [Niabella sp.]HQW16153.1 DPP IV N-terminal domain-containing protein [Niabella sp.]HQX21365.1 DPP IV N-terminal domain-containing protein [Niabella sp.]HQX42241.1 DPP IV N-terminal domain-containing protein [Niabella sp.]
MYRNVLIILSVLVVSIASAQNKQLTAEDYKKAEQFLGATTSRYVDWNSPVPHWLENDAFWYKTGGKTYLVDPAKKTKTETKQFGADANPPRSFRWTNMAISPDKKKEIFIREWNLWVRDLQTQKETQLTTDGEKDYGYGTDNAGWKHSDNPVLKWSPDSKKIATFQQDQRKVNDMYLVSTNVGAPKLMQWKYPLPGDKYIPTIRRVIINVDNVKVISLNVAPDPHRATMSDDIASSGSFDDIDWTPDASEMAFVSTSRDHKNAKVRIANAATGEVKEIFEEIVKTQFESGRDAINWRYLPGTNEIIWYSEKDNWGHLYLYDSKTGKLKHQITKGDWLVGKLLKVDEANRVLYFTGYGKEKGNPYFGYLYKVGMDGKGLTLLTPETGNHSVSFSPSGNFFIDTYSQPDVPPVSVLRSINGQSVVNLEKADVSRLASRGWKAPFVAKLKAADGVTDIYGLVFTPSKLDPSKKYPVVDYIYPGPQGGSVGSWSFSASRGDHQALAELGFIVVVVEGTGNPFRSKSFHDACYGNMSVNTLPDQIAAIRQLSKTYPMDTTKVGIWGHSGGGFATAAALFRYPDFFKVGVSQSGNHDNRNYEDDWGERYNGLVDNSDYAIQANQVYAGSLKGKLMLAHGLMDDNVPPYGMFLVVEALAKANKDYDLIVFPNSAHGYGSYNNYMMRRRWDYFVKNLAGNLPPKEYLIGGEK